jgi:beta-N-acetylhexosaminidase
MSRTSERGATGHTTTLADRKRRAGQRLIVGLASKGLNAEERRFVAEVAPAGFILFARNIEEPRQVLELNRELHSLLPDERPPFLSVDQEGGRVLRMKATLWPSMRVLGNLDHPQTTRQVARAMADELRAVGFNLDFAPVCDVDSNPKNPVIGDRSFSRSPEKVARHASVFMEGLHERGVVACAKHFPGHGDTSSDSHLTLPVVDKELGELRETELVPFRRVVKEGIGLVMTSHVLFPALDEKWPATLSERVLGGLLREELEYSGVVISDDLEMKAVRARFELDQILERATRSGVDLFCIGRSFEPDLTLSMAAFEHLVRMQEQSPGLETRTKDGVKRVRALRHRFLLAPPAPPGVEVVGCPAFQALAASVRARGGEPGLA